MRRKPKPNKSDFVRKMGSAPARDVVAAAKKAGIKLTERYVYVIRSADKAKARRKGNLRDWNRGRIDVKVDGRRRQHGGDERELRQAIAEIGLARSRQIFQDVERSLTA